MGNTFNAESPASLPRQAMSSTDAVVVLAVVVVALVLVATRLISPRGVSREG